MRQTRVLIYCGEDEAPARALSARLRSENVGAMVLSALAFEGAEPCDSVIVMPGVPLAVMAKLKASYPGKCGQQQTIPSNVVPIKRGRGRPRKVKAS
jgi:hypothetical protein